MGTKSKESALDSLQWANIISVIFSCLLLLFGGLLSYVFYQKILAYIILAAGLLLNILLTVLFAPAAHREAIGQPNREEAVKIAYRGRLNQIICIVGYILLSILLIPLWASLLDTGACIALLPVIAGVYILTVAGIMLKKDSQLTTTEERVNRAKKLRPMRMNILSAVIAIMAVLCMQVYRVVWLYTSVREDWISAVTIGAFAFFYICILIFPLFVLKTTKEQVKKKVIRICGLRNILVAVGLLILNLSASFLKEDTTRTVEIDPVCLTVGIIWMLLFFLLFEIILRIKYRSNKNRSE